MSLVLSTLQQQWLQEIQVATPFIAPYRSQQVPVKAPTLVEAKVAGPKSESALISVVKSTPTPASAPAPAPKAAPIPVAALQPMADLTQMSLVQLQAYVEQCQACALHEQRTQVVWGAGQVQQPDWFVISTAPSSNEELAGLPMQGKSGELFAAQMQSIGIDIEQQLYITQLVKCRASNKPDPEHIKECRAILLRQIELIQPQRLLLLGAKATAMFLGNEQSFEALRGKAHQWQGPHGQTLPVVVSYHPVSLFSRPQFKAQAWADLRLIASMIRSE